VNDMAEDQSGEKQIIKTDPLGDLPKEGRRIAIHKRIKEGLRKYTQKLEGEIPLEKRTGTGEYPVVNQDKPSNQREQ